MKRILFSACLLKRASAVEASSEAHREVTRDAWDLRGSGLFVSKTSDCVSGPAGFVTAFLIFLIDVYFSGCAGDFLLNNTMVRIIKNHWPGRCGSRPEFDVYP